MSKATFNYSDNNGEHSFEITVKLSSDLDLYFRLKDIPECIHPYMPNGSERFYSGDWYELRSIITKAIHDYESTFVKESKKKVICYHCNFEDPTFGSSIELAFGYRVLDKVTLGDNTHYEYSSTGRGDRSMLHNVQETNDPFRNFAEFNEMDWTAEREEWFRQVEKKLKDMSLHIMDGINKRSNLLASQIDNGSLTLLLGGSNDSE